MCGPRGYLPGVIRCADIDLDSGRLRASTTRRGRWGEGEGGSGRRTRPLWMLSLARPHNCVCEELEPLKFGACGSEAADLGFSSFHPIDRPIEGAGERRRDGEADTHVR